MEQEPYKSPVPIIEHETRLVSKFRPHDVNLSSLDSLACTFGKSEVESTAENLIKFFQKRDVWHLFRLEDYVAFCKEEGFRGGLFGLMGAWFDDGGMGEFSGYYEDFLISFPDGTICITEAFLNRIQKLHLKAAS